MLYFKAWDVVSREKKAQCLNFGPNLTTCKPGAGQEAGTGLQYPCGEDTHHWAERTRHVKCHPSLANSNSYKAAISPLGPVD